MMMMRSSSTKQCQSALVLLMLMAMAVSVCLGFQAPPVQSGTSRTSTQLYIISGAFKKYKAEQEKKKMPMATREEAKLESPGLRVGSSVWKWPPVWPYDRQFFMPTEDIPKAPQMSMNQMASMVSGIQQAPGAAEPTLEEQQANQLDVYDFWGNQKADVKTEMDQEAIEKLKAHYDFYLQDGASILELGAAEESYLPDSVKPSRHVGIGLNQKLMDINPSLTETMIVDLNTVVEDRDVDNDEFRLLAQDPFDAVIMANTVEFLTNPREVLRSAWYMLKPGGQMFIVFSGKDAPLNSKFERAATKVWRDYNDDQHMWICGSLFEFSAGDGWDSLRGFNISPESAKDMSTVGTNPLENMMNQGKPNNIFVVQAVKGAQDDSLNADNLEKSITSKMWMMPVVEPRDKNLVIPRLVRSIEMATEGEQKERVTNAIENNIATIPKVYEALVKMDQFAFTFSMQAQLATELIINPDFNANEDQLVALKQGLGLRKPSKDFWEPLGQYTSQMDVEDKISLLGYIVPCFGSNDPDQLQALQDYASGLKPTMNLVRMKCPGLPEPDVQLIATEFLAAEILKPGQTTREDFAKWLGEMTEDEIKAPLVARQKLRRSSAEELEAFQEEIAEQKAEFEKTKERYEEIKKQARENRSMILNGRTGKFEEYKP
ncbi:Methyltransferase domain [Seminavis robusta]|uniref:Methyltransferase domain n=1 Tax=Seminavis robusta TaxID=568900 RepID=A0A9N8E0V1_9STRA|nr:Methyltransferase domain [Seminavis robusta]|eukprot:Sro511_g157470.1 Methyltransferase domain (659) ;mRNA; r:40959-43201